MNSGACGLVLKSVLKVAVACYPEGRKHCQDNPDGFPRKASNDKNQQAGAQQFWYRDRQQKGLKHG